MERKYNGQLEINDLIDDAVKNAVERRNQGLDSEDALSDEEMKSVAGGIISKSLLISPVLIGIIAYPSPDKILLS
ncbi:MAG: hypothetical protein V7L14_31445 [Nostoc sp.]|uniref:hypothetical protein n=1 Tax=Nostoc sp. TaxID=1180 RepID=UPI002FF63A8D